jgi:hypothetical protein
VHKGDLSSEKWGLQEGLNLMIPDWLIAEKTCNFRFSMDGWGSKNAKRIYNS